MSWELGCILIFWPPWWSCNLHNPVPRDIHKPARKPGISVVKSLGNPKILRIFQSWRLPKKLNYVFFLFLIWNLKFFETESTLSRMYCQLALYVSSNIIRASFVWKRTVLNLTSSGLAAFSFSRSCSRYRRLRISGRILCILRIRDPLHEELRTRDWYRARSIRC